MSSALIPEPPILLCPSLAAEVGISEAAFLQQLHYWTLKSEDGWVFKTQDVWLREMPWLSKRSLQRITAQLREAGYIETRQPDGQKRRNHYRLDYSKLPDAANVAGSSRQSGRFLNREEDSVRRKPKAPSSTSQEIEDVWSRYVAAMKPRKKEAGPEERRVIRGALKEATVKECQAAIIGCKLSDFHMKRGDYLHRKGGRYNKLSDILRGKRGKQTIRERIDFFLDLKEAAKEGSGLDALNERAASELKRQGISE